MNSIRRPSTVKMNCSFSPDSSVSRRAFLATTAAVAAQVAAGISASAAESVNSETAQAKRLPIGLELYSVRGELARDLPKTLKTVSLMGYEAVEIYSPSF